ncbi:MAG: HNH endonuclease, partial [Paucibacter sp.]|nr:HNH endonuclease [Roseateles sp.]
MPTAAAKPCTQCGVLVRDGSSRCMAHKVKAGTFADSRRGSRHERGYGSAWDKIRARILKRDAGLCQPCLALGIVHAGTHIDHKVSKAEWKRLHGSLDGCDDDSNLQAINADCHKLKTQAEAAAARGLASHPQTPTRADASKTSGPGAP